MEKRNKFTLTLVTSFILIYAILAVVETVSLSSKTVDEAFEKFIKGELKSENEIGDKVVYPYGDGDYELVIYEMGGHISLVQFEKGLFGWIRTFYSHDKNGGYSYSNNNNELFHGVIPKDIVTKTKSVKVNNIDAEIITLNDKVKVWIMINDEGDKHDFDNIYVNFLDNDGKVIGEI